MKPQDIADIFHAALAQDRLKRKEYVKSQVNNNEDFELIWGLIEQSEKQSNFMATSYELCDTNPSLQIGAEIGRWRVLEPLGSGGMGEVYKVARNTDDFEQIAALKITRASQHELHQRFHEERRILARLEHPNIGRLIDGGVSENGEPYMVTEFIDGPDIVDYAVQHALSRDQKLALFKQLCLATHHAHERMVLHRDIKPSNILVVNDGLVKLIDFGVSGFMDKQYETETAPFTRAYAAPEQLEGGTLNRSTDIYALGQVLKSLFIGGDTPEQSTTSLGNELNAIYQKCTCHNKQGRYQTAQELQDDIERLRRSLPVAAMDGGRWYRIGKFITRKPLVIASALLTIASLGIGAYMYYSTRQIKLENQHWYHRAENSKGVNIASARTALGCNETSIQIHNRQVTTTGSLTAKQARLVQLAQDYLQSDVPIKALSLTPDCNGIAMLTDTSQHTSNVRGDLPIHYYETLNRLRQEDKKITAIAFDPDRWQDRAAYVIVYEGGYEASPDTSRELLQRIKDAMISDGAVIGLAFYPNKGRQSGWSVLGADGYQFTRNVVHEGKANWYYENLRFLREQKIIPTFVSFSPDGKDYVLGNPQCVYSSRAELTQLAGCPAFLPD